MEDMCYERLRADAVAGAVTRSAGRLGFGLKINEHESHIFESCLCFFIFIAKRS